MGCPPLDVSSKSQYVSMKSQIEPGDLRERP